MDLYTKPVPMPEYTMPPTYVELTPDKLNEILKKLDKLIERIGD